MAYKDEMSFAEDLSNRKNLKAGDTVFFDGDSRPYTVNCTPFGPNFAVFTVFSQVPNEWLMDGLPVNFEQLQPGDLVVTKDLSESRPYVVTESFGDCAVMVTTRSLKGWKKSID